MKEEKSETNHADEVVHILCPLCGKYYDWNPKSEKIAVCSSCKSSFLQAIKDKMRK